MAKLLVVGLDQETAVQMLKALPSTEHRVECREEITSVQDLEDADLVFAGGEKGQRISLLRWIKEALPWLPCVVAARLPDTREWLEALEAGATDYCGAPFEGRQMETLIRSALTEQTRAAA